MMTSRRFTAAPVCYAGCRAERLHDDGTGTGSVSPSNEQVSFHGRARWRRQRHHVAALKMGRLLGSLSASHQQTQSKPSIVVDRLEYGWAAGALRVLPGYRFHDALLRPGDGQPAGCDGSTCAAISISTTRPRDGGAGRPVQLKAAARWMRLPTQLSTSTAR